MLSRPLAILCALGVALLPGQVRAKEIHTPCGTLGQYVPDDVFVFNAFVQTPSRAFLSRHWNRVCCAVRDCGIEADLKALIESELSAQEKTAFNKSWNQIASAFAKVRWSGLIAREFAFAQRFSSLMPDYIFLCRPATKTLPQNIEGLSAILKLFAQLDTEGDFTFTEETVDGVRTWSLEAVEAPLGFHLLSKDDVLVVMMGRTAMADIRALLSGRKNCRVRSILQSPRFHAALQQVPQAEFMVSYVDLQRLFDMFKNLPRMLFGEKEATAGFASTGKKFIQVIVKQLDFLDYGIATGRMEGHKEFVESYFQVRPGSEAKPLYRMLADRHPIANFQRYIPVEASEFSVCSLLDFELLYDTILDTVRTVAPNGEALLAKWANLQEDMGLDLKEDVFSWLSGEAIDIAFPAAAASPMGGNRGVLLIRVRDAEKARAKVYAGLDRLAALAAEKGQALTVAPETDERLPGFRTINHPVLALLAVRPCIGVWEDWLVVGEADSVILVLETAAGKHASILENPRFRAEGLVPDGAVRGVSFKDMRNFGNQMRSVFVGLGFAAAMFPADDPGARPLKRMIQATSKLGTVFNEIDFFSSVSRIKTFHDHAWRTTTLTTYRAAPPANQP